MGDDRSTRRAAELAVSLENDTSERLPVSNIRLVELARQVLAAEKVKRAMVSITLLSPRRMAALNMKHLGHRGATDVITFALGQDPVGAVIGDIYICPAVARAQATDHGVGIREEIARLVVHGVLHTCGHSHPEGDDRIAAPMWRRQESLLRRLWLSPATRA